MGRHLRAGAVAAALLGMACPLPAGQKLYHLRKIPKFRVGDKAIQKLTDSDVSSMASGGKIVQERRRRKESHCVHEVLEVDRAGKVQAFRVTIVSAKAHIVLEGAEPGKKDVAIEKIHFIARRKGLYFQGDRTTVVSEKAAKLKASQIWLLKESCTRGMSFAAYPESDVMFFPAMPVPVGHSWKPSRKVLNEWLKADPAAKATGGKALLVEMKFVSIKDDIALVKGDVLVEAYLPGAKRKLEIPGVFTWNIDTGSGRWAGYATSSAFSYKNEGATFKTRFRREQTSTFRAGKGKASALPGKLFKLGWKPPGKDTNNHKDPGNGFSLNVPTGYAPIKLKPGGLGLAEFENKLGAKIRVYGGFKLVPVDVEEYVRFIEAAMRQAKSDYKLVERKNLVLPGNVPAALLVWQPGDAEAPVLTLTAFDGRRVLTVRGTASTADKRNVAEMREVLKTFRVFKPEMTKAP